ncbi:hypothetical protein FKW77_010523 [Venturia effusa]|uniref:Aminoglycoside phosphotransferase domain-containing protein n=1 Tax=Venturia effusa TaxID=50376 RepID=A0A517KXT6_9PEZI|nr:hypothetical protein FKW77_010523 [Venturia effusa]
MAGAVRQPIDVASFERYIQQNVPEIKTPLDVKQFGYGQSNPTYQLTDKTGTKYVMRKKPPGKLLSATAHQVEREYRIIHALEKTDVPVPKAYCLCEDGSIVGTPFYIMSFLDGRIFEDPAIPGVSPEHRAAMWKDAVETLAKFHRVVPASVKMETFGKPSGFYNRQLRTFNTIQTAQAQAVSIKTGEPVGKIPHFDEMAQFFGDTRSQPKDRSTFVHGDYKIDNMVFHKTEPKVIGILDWEMATIGHPLSDLSNLLSPYTMASIPGNITRINPAFKPAATSHPGLPTKAQCIQWYTAIAGYDPLPDLTWSDAFGSYRGAVIVQGIAARFAMGVASSAKAEEYAVQLKPLSEVAWQLVQRWKEQHEGGSRL